MKDLWRKFLGPTNKKKTVSPFVCSSYKSQDERLCN